LFNGHKKRHNILEIKQKSFSASLLGSTKGKQEGERRAIAVRTANKALGFWSKEFEKESLKTSG
jgi:hypothetical protein